MRFPTNGSRERYPKGSLIQGFGENPELYKVVNQKGHNGWDIVGKYGEPILAPHSGKVYHVDFYSDETKNGYGNNIIIMSDPDEDGICIESTLAHMTRNIKITQNQRVEEGQQVGEMGNSGFIVSGGVIFWQNSNPDKRGTHLHWTTKRYRLVNGNYQLIKSDYNGAFDPAELFKKEPMKKFIVQDGSKLGVMILEGETGVVQFAPDMDSFKKLSEVAKLTVDTKTIQIP